MLKKILAGGVLALALFGVVSCGAKQPSKIVIASDATFPPMEMVDENKAIVGLDVDLMNAAAKAGGFTVEFKNTAWDGIFAGLDNGKYDAVMSSVTITDERKKTMDFSMPYFNAGQILVVKSDVNGVQSLADLKGKTVGAQIGTTGAFEIDKVKDANKITPKTYDEIGLAFEDLVNGRIAGVVVDTPTAANYALSGFVDWRIAAEYLAGGALGGWAGASLAVRLAKERRLLHRTFAAVLVVVALYMLCRSLSAIV